MAQVAVLAGNLQKGTQPKMIVYLKRKEVRTLPYLLVDILLPFSVSCVSHKYLMWGILSDIEW